MGKFDSDRFRVTDGRTVFRVPEKMVGQGGKHLIIVSEGSLPCDMRLKVFASEDGVHHEFEVVSCGGIAVEVDACFCFEDSFHFHDADGHIDQVRHHAIAMDGSGCGEEFVETWIVFGDLPVPGEVDIGESPSISEFGAGGFAADRRGVACV